MLVLDPRQSCTHEYTTALYKKLGTPNHVSFFDERDKLQDEWSGADESGRKAVDAKIAELEKSRPKATGCEIYNVWLFQTPLKTTKGQRETSTRIACPHGRPTRHLREVELLFGLGSKLDGFELDHVIFIVDYGWRSHSHSEDVEYIKGLGKSDTLEILQVYFFNGHKTMDELYDTYQELLEKEYEPCEGIFNDQKKLVIDRFFPI